MDVDLTAPTRPAPPAPGPARRAGAHTALVVAVAAAIAIGVAMRFAAHSDLWFDEALTVNIAKLPLDRLRTALLHDGAPPLSYVVLHFWMVVFGTSTAAVRALSGVLGVLAIALGALALRAWSPTTDGAARDAALGALVVATSPFALRYSTEVRMYALTIVLGLLGVLLAAPAWRRPTPARLAGIATVTAGLVYTQYWSFFLVGSVAAGLLVAAVRGTPTVAHRSRRLLVAVLAGVVVFAPWWPTFSEQLAHTGTPWDAPTTMYAGLRRSVLAFGGSGWPRWVVTAVIAGLAVTAWTAVRRMRTEARLAGAVALSTIVVGVAGSVVAGAGFQDRYLAVAFPFVAVVVAWGAAAVGPSAVRVAVVSVLAVAGLASGWHALRAPRTASTAIAAVLRADLHADDLVAYCPDQLGPSTARLLPANVDQVTFPELASPRLVDWTDYADRHAAASPAAFAAEVVGRAGRGRVFLVFSGGYRTLGTKCEATVNALASRRPHVTHVTVADGPNGERVALDRFDP